MSCYQRPVAPAPLTQAQRQRRPSCVVEWHGVYGYVKKHYTGVWFDNMANTTVSGSGEADKTGRILSFRGEHVDPRDGKAKFLWRISNDAFLVCSLDHRIASAARDPRCSRRTPFPHSSKNRSHQHPTGLQCGFVRTRMLHSFDRRTHCLTVHTQSPSGPIQPRLRAFPSRNNLDHIPTDRILKGR